MQFIERILGLSAFTAARTICCYLALSDEPETRPLIEALWVTQKFVSAPKITGPGTMVAVPIQSWADLQPGIFGILEPIADQPTVTTLDVVIVPGRAFTVRGDRKGRGRGYYDRFLALHPDAVRIGVCHDSQLVDGLPVATHDEPMDWIVTDSRTIETGARQKNLR